ncbi:hypothetical protein [Erwinia pyrifoliae]|uniref:Uncharacterized protein n=1 Tax=Erwinia pyrifoliae TaxID=79967 RepID=A0ABY5X3G5_ERWPY|nr:hypothetical protein [Erwinia pyrifoliae]AUX72514.1 hypothetical protein CPI84_08510 [Erwinia pyrifoliae]MCA8877234.1 hypothetical protein [Erwinia pyrifoliae]MCT2387417.1 hypothetical protein [Erwinia pyrifoliae]MCU8586983.1 hypothetical protein [Erwinia pyrifoliae]UWS30851.1 hypothetical protein NYP81_05170 [Erwinia pyrifoliae]
MLNALPIDEWVVQSYLGRHSASNYADYLAALSGLRTPLQPGIVQYALWRQKDELRLVASRWYRGVVVLMLNARQLPFHALKHQDGAL